MVRCHQQVQTSKKMKKICIVTTARSEYGLLRWVIEEVYNSPELILQLVVTGGHLSAEQGYTCRAIEDDGYPIASRVDIDVDSSSQVGICKTMATCQGKMADTFFELKPDLLVVLGDRYELLPICSTALMMNIPIAHIAGGDITEGALDNSVRNAVTMMSTYHFPGTNESAERVIRMKGNSNNVFVVGETNIDNFNRISLWSRERLAESLHIDMNKRWVICTYHSETVLSIEDNMNRVNILSKLFTNDLSEYEIIITKSNADFGGSVINKFFEEQTVRYDNIHLFSSLGQARYISMLYQVEFMIGNSSSGIFESPYVGVPCVNLGNRQKGRVYSSNIITVDGRYDSMLKAIRCIYSEEFKKGLEIIDNPYGDGHSSERIVQIIKDKLYV